MMAPAVLAPPLVYLPVPGFGAVSMRSFSMRVL
jgi:hypothetical protein